MYTRILPPSVLGIRRFNSVALSLYRALKLNYGWMRRRGLERMAFLFRDRGLLGMKSMFEVYYFVLLERLEYVGR